MTDTRKNVPTTAGWAEAVPWMGCPTDVLTALVARNRFRVDLSRWPGLLFDLGFSTFNSGLGLLRDVCAARVPTHPTFAQPPVFILGHWRTGTTWLHELLALDPRHRAPTTFECFLPRHVFLSAAWLKWWTTFLLPPNRPPDNMQMGWDLPQEDEFALLLLGRPSVYQAIAFPNEKLAWQDALDIDSLPADEQVKWERTWLWFLKQLEMSRPGQLVLKSPQHTCRIPTILKLFPDARFVYLVRDPAAVIPSTLRLWKTMYAAYAYQTPNMDGLDETVLAMFQHFYERMEATRNLIPPGRLVELRYEDLVAEPVAQLDRLYHQLDLGDFEEVRQAVTSDVARRADYQTNKHQLPPALAAQIATRCARYAQQHGYTAEQQRAEQADIAPIFRRS